VAGEDPLKWEQVLDMKIIEFLNHLSFIKDKARHTNEQNKKAFAK
jgi:hypothetical protein